MVDGNTDCLSLHSKSYHIFSKVTSFTALNSSQFSLCGWRLGCYRCMEREVRSWPPRTEDLSCRRKQLSDTVANVENPESIKGKQNHFNSFSMLACVWQLLFKFNHLRADFIIHSNGGIHLQRATSLSALLRDALFHEEMWMQGRKMSALCKQEPLSIPHSRNIHSHEKDEKI